MHAPELLSIPRILVCIQERTLVILIFGPEPGRLTENIQMTEASKRVDVSY